MAPHILAALTVFNQSSKNNKRDEVQKKIYLRESSKRNVLNEMRRSWRVNIFYCIHV